MRTPDADRFRHECEVPDPPLSPKGRQRYWDETVFEAVAELRKRLRGQDAEVALEALEMILDLEKTRIRHGSKVSGTHVPNLPDLEDDWGNPVPTPPAAGRAGGVRPVLTETQPGEPQTQQGADAPRSPEPPPTRSPEQRVGSPPAAPYPIRSPGAEVFTWPPARAQCPPRIPGVTGVFSDRDDDWTRDPNRCRIEDDDPVPLDTPLPRRYPEPAACHGFSHDPEPAERGRA